MPEQITYTEVAQGKQTGGAYSGSPSYNFTNTLPTANMVDGDETTGTGFYYGAEAFTGYLYVDLGLPHKIDHIEIVAYDNVRPYNAGEFNLIATNMLPDATLI